MSASDGPAKMQVLSPTSVAPEATPPKKLDDVLLAMDVVDTLRHRERIVDQELDAEARESGLIGRLKEIYTAQGIDVPERILKDGVKALEERRFLYAPPTDSVSVRLARLYVDRGRWLPKAIGLAGVLAALIAGWLFFWVLPNAAAWGRLPTELHAQSAKAQALAVDSAVDQKIAALERAGLAAVAANDRREAFGDLSALKDMVAQLDSDYVVRIVSRPGESSGFYRIPHDNPTGRNYYLVVEAISPSGRALAVPIFNEETQKLARVSKWAQRVSRDEFNKIAAEKAETQIVADAVLGRKTRGELVPKYDVDTPGGAISKW